MDIQPLVDALQPWADLYADSTWLPTVVVSLHLCALLFGGGVAVAADRATWRATGAGQGLAQQLDALATSHAPVLMALGVLVISGALMTTADLGTFWSSTAYLVKQGCVALLLANGAVLTLTERALRRAAATGAPLPPALVQRLRWSSAASLLLWGATTVAGVALTNFA